MGIDKVVGAARVLYSENISELMEAMAEDARDARDRRNAGKRCCAQPVREPAGEDFAQDRAAFANEDVNVPRRTAA